MPPLVGDPLANLLALKRSSYSTPAGDEISPGLAESDPGLMFPSPITESGSDRRSADERLMQYFSAESPSMQQQRRQVAAFENERANALAENDPTIRAARESAQQEELQKAGKTLPQLGEAERVRGEYALKAGAQADQQKQDALRNLLGAAPGGMSGYKMNINANMEPSFSQVEVPTQTRQNARFAKDTMGLLSETDAMFDDPDLQPYIGTVMGRLDRLGNNPTAMSDYAKSLSATPQVQRKLGDFGLKLVASSTAVARAHALRGLPPALIDEFKQQLRASQTPDLAHGAFGAAHKIMQGYASEDPSLGIPDPYGEQR